VWLVGVLAALWVLVLAIDIYGAHRILSVGWRFELLVWALRCVALLATVILAAHALIKRAWLRAVVIVLIGVLGAVSVARAGFGRSGYWNAYNRELVARHDDLVALAAAYDRGEIHDGSPLPRSIRKLTDDGRAHVWGATGGIRVLFIQRWQDWRAESGDGIAYFRTPPAPGTDVVTAEGDLGQPTRDLGDGWWVVPS